jgi:glycosyltransferase involved in cell wall biosynthesis
MKIAYDANLLTVKEKTGIPNYQKYIIKHLQKIYKDNTYYFNLFSVRHTPRKIREIYEVSSLDPEITKLNIKCFPKEYYDKIGSFIPYSFFFRDKVQITHFFDYIIPWGTSGKKIITIYDMTFKTFPETMNEDSRNSLNKNIRLSTDRTDKIVAISEFSKGEIIKYLNISEKKFTVIPCGVDHELFYPINNKESITNTLKKYNIQGDYFLYIGTIEPRKNIERLIDSYHILKERHTDLPLLLFVGKLGWLYDSIIKKITSLGLEKHIIKLGFIPDDDMLPLLCGAYAFVYPSLYEGFGIPPLEAMSCGVPVLTSNVSSLPEVVGEAAIKVNPFDIEEIADGLERLFLNNELRASLIQKGIDQAKKFSWDRSAVLTMDLYKSLC